MMTATAKTDALLKRLCSQVEPWHPLPRLPPADAIRCHLMLRVRYEEPFKYCIFTYISVVVLRAACCMLHAAWVAAWLVSFVFMLQRAARKCVNNEDANSRRSWLNRKCNQVVAESETYRFHTKPVGSKWGRAKGGTDRQFNQIYKCRLAFIRP